MAEKQYADESFMAEYSSYLKENALDPINSITNSLMVINEPGPYLKLTSENRERSIQIMTNGAFDGNNTNSGMGIKFQSKDQGGQDDPQSYGNIALKADPRHGWDYLLTLPNETGTLATRNYVDDRLSFSSTPPSTAQVVFCSGQNLYSSSTCTFSSLGYAALKGELSVNAAHGTTSYAELKDTQGTREIVASKQSSVLLYVEEADVGQGSSGEDVRLVMTNSNPNNAPASLYVSLASNYTYWIQLFGGSVFSGGLARIYRMPANGGSWSFVKSITYDDSSVSFFLLCVGGDERSGSDASATVHFIAS